MRMCVACREMRAKKDLMRVVRTGGGLKLDKTGKLNGRGAGGTERGGVSD